jgi:hypothetical protein
MIQRVSPIHHGMDLDGGTHHKRASGIQRYTNRWCHPCDVGSRRITKDEHASGGKCSRKYTGNKTIFGFTDAVLESIWLEDEPNETAIDHDSDSGTNDDGNEHHAHYSDGETIDFEIYNREGLEE